MKINDFSAIQGLFDELNKRLERAQKLAVSTAPTPKVYIKLLVGSVSTGGRKILCALD